MEGLEDCLFEEQSHSVNKLVIWANLGSSLRIRGQSSGLALMPMACVHGSIKDNSQLLSNQREGSKGRWRLFSPHLGCQWGSILSSLQIVCPCLLCFPEVLFYRNALLLSCKSHLMALLQMGQRHTRACVCVLTHSRSQHLPLWHLLSTDLYLLCWRCCL